MGFLRGAAGVADAGAGVGAGAGAVRWRGGKKGGGTASAAWWLTVGLAFLGGGGGLGVFDDAGRAGVLGAMVLVVVLVVGFVVGSDRGLTSGLIASPELSFIRRVGPTKVLDGLYVQHRQRHFDILLLFIAGCG